MAKQIQEPAELSNQEIEQLRESAYAIEQDIKSAMQRGREALWMLAKGFYEFEEVQGWKVLGHEKLNDWLAQPEVSVTYRTFKRYTRSYREIVVMRQIPMESLDEVDLTKMDIVLPAIEAGRSTVEDALSDVKVLGARDLRENYIGPQSPPSRPGDDGEKDAAGGTTTAVGGDADKGQEPVSGDVVEGTATDIPKGNAKPQGPPEWVHSARTVDSWVEMGGDRRKAQRHWNKLVEENPALKAVATITAFFEGAEDAPGKDEVAEAWAALSAALGIDFTSAE